MHLRHCVNINTGIQVCPVNESHIGRKVPLGWIPVRVILPKISKLVKILTLKEMKTLYYTVQK